MATKLDVIIQHALKTFTKYIKRFPEFSQTEVSELKSLADTITSSDVHNLRGLLNSRSLDEFMRRKRTSLDYLPVYEDEWITVGVFLLNEGTKLPIHDHPNMYGIIKVLEGVVKVSSYSIIEVDKSFTCNSHLYYRNPLKVIKHPQVFVGKEDSSCLLTPTDKNFHEVECVRGPAAFLDILSPPYEDGNPNEPRVCHYFDELKTNQDEFYRLIQIFKQHCRRRWKVFGRSTWPVGENNPDLWTIRKGLKKKNVGMFSVGDIKQPIFLVKNKYN